MKSKPIFTKSKQPVLAPRADVEWASGAVFNPGAWRDVPSATNEAPPIHLLFRAVPAGYQRIKMDIPEDHGFTEGFDDTYISYIGYAKSSDGTNFDWRDKPIIAPDREFDKFGAEDARISKIDDTYLITYTGLSHPAFGIKDGVRIALATTTDFETVTKHGIVGPAVRDKDCVIFPKRIGGRIAMLHRVVPNIQIAYFENLDELCNPRPDYWDKHMANLREHVIMTSEFSWESNKIGAGSTPIETSEGWLIIYHGVDDNLIYRAGMALLDIDDPTHVIARYPYPVLEPELDFELIGDVNNVVFAEGTVVIDDVLHLYYGGADKVVGHATANLDHLLELLLSNAAGATRKSTRS